MRLRTPRQVTSAQVTAEAVAVPGVIAVDNRLVPAAEGFLHESPWKPRGLSDCQRLERCAVK
jgi:hypothetical protein